VQNASGVGVDHQHGALAGRKRSWRHDMHGDRKRGHEPCNA
jgi:hypothetical protein